MTDSLLDSDLAALGKDSRRDPLPIDASLRTMGVYRDDRPGIEARRDSLREQRRHELALMPLTYAHVFAHRAARAAAGGVAVIAAVSSLLFLSQPPRVFVPGLNLTTCAALFVATVVSVYVIATWIAERVFAARMREAIASAGEVHADLDRLAVGPVEVAGALVRRADFWAIVLSIAGLISVAVLCGFVVFVLGRASANPLSWWPSRAALPIMRNALLMLFAVAVGCAVAVAIGRAVMRAQRWLLDLRTRIVLSEGIIAGVITFAVALDQVGQPPLVTRLMLVGGGLVSVLLVATSLVLWWRRREERRLL